MKRIVAAALSAALLLGVLTGCGGEEESYTPTGDALSQEEITRPTTQGTVQRTTMPYAPEQGLNPYNCIDHNNKVLFSLIYQGLFAMDQDYQVWPILCESYHMSWDMKTYTFRLAKATFSDGSPVTAEDAAASLLKAKDSMAYGGRFNYVDEILVTGDGQLQITLKTPYENLPLLLDVPIVKATQVEAEMPLGSGPYSYERQGEGLGLRRCPGWWCDVQPPVEGEHLSLLKVESAAQLRDAFEFSGLSMVCADPGSDSFADFHSDHELWDSENGIFLYLACNDESPVFSLPVFRKALTWTVNREVLVESFYRDFAYATALPASPKAPFYSEALANTLGYDPQRMNLAVAENPQVLELPVTLLVNSGDRVRQRAARSIAKDLSASGLKVILSELTGDRYQKALKEGEFDLHLGQTKLSANMDLSAFFKKSGALAYGGMEDSLLLALCQETLANAGNYYTLYQRILEDGQLCPLLFRSYAVYVQRGSFSELQPARDNLFFYHLGRTQEEARREE